MPCYNAGKYIREAIESVVDQTYQDWELIIVNDGSTDNSQEVVEDYIQSASNTYQIRIRLINQPNSGACRARNNGIEHANGEYIKFLDADDKLMPTCLEEQVQQIQSLRDNQIPFGYYGHIDEKGTLVSQYHFSQEDLSEMQEDAVYFFFHNWHMLISAPLHRTSILKQLGGFDEALPRDQEFDLHLRLAIAGVECVYFHTYTFVYRGYESQYRISCATKTNIHARKTSTYIRATHSETLLLAKYGTMPVVYRNYFTNTWFSKARDEFASKHVSEGKQFLQRACAYGLKSRFQRGYLLVGKLIGYVNLESLLQLRLRLLHKA